MLFLSNEQQTLNFDLYMFAGAFFFVGWFLGFFYDSPYSPHQA